MTIISAFTLLGTSLLTTHFVSKSDHYMYKAINIYNGVGTESRIETPPQTSVSPFSSPRQKVSANSISISIPF